MSADKTVVLISGATGVIGYAIANELAATPDYVVVLLARDRDRAEETADDIRRATGNDNVRFVLADVSRRVAGTRRPRGFSSPGRRTFSAIFG